MCISGGVGEVVEPVLLVKPGRLKETSVVVIGEDGLAGIGAEDLNFLDFAIELEHVVRELRYASPQSKLALAARFLGTLPLRIVNVIPLLVALELTAPETAEIDVRLAVIIDEDSGVDAVASLDRLGLRGEGPLGFVTNGNTDPEDSLLVAGGEVEVVFPILSGSIGGP